MYNSDTPLRVELPSSKQLLRSTILAAVSATALLATVVLPAEYGIDPTGVGSVLRLTDMGKTKMQLAAEADNDAAADAKVNSRASYVPPAVQQQIKSPAAGPSTSAQIKWRDETRFTLAPGQGLEIKLRMIEGAKAEFAWAVEGEGAVNYDTHGDGSGRSISYEKGRGVPSDEGELVAAFAGNHGWFWRNRGNVEVAVVLRTRGDYIDIRRPS
tara:strand:- start:80776 stop:81414 length:639 start_codon:yes stop_codon:yes gene_type:complete